MSHLLRNRFWGMRPSKWRTYLTGWPWWSLTLVGLTLVFNVLPPCPVEQHILPNSHLPKQNQAHRGMSKIIVNRTQVRDHRITIAFALQYRSIDRERTNALSLSQEFRNQMHYLWNNCAGLNRYKCTPPLPVCILNYRHYRAVQLNFTLEIEVFYMLFEICAILCMTSLKLHKELKEYSNLQ